MVLLFDKVSSIFKLLPLRVAEYFPVPRIPQFPRGHSKRQACSVVEKDVHANA